MKKTLLFSLIALLALSQLVKAEITTEQPSYRPGQIVNITLNSSDPLGNVEFVIIRPNGILETSKSIKMKIINPYLWIYNYSFKSNALNGTYLINVTAYPGSELVNASSKIFYFNKKFDIIAWNVNASLNKYSFEPGETIDLTVLITDKYSEALQFSASYNLKDSRKIDIKKYSLTLTAVNQGFFDSYEVLENHTPGKSTIEITLTDSEKRSYSTTLNFTVENYLYYANQTKTDKNENDYSYIIWYFAIGIVIVIIILTLLRHKKIAKKKKEEEKKRKQIEEEEKRKFFVKPHEEYRTEYY